MELERKQVVFDEIKASEDGEGRTIEGYGSIYGNVDSYGDIVLAGAFTKTLKRGRPKMLWQHNSEQPIGVWNEIEERDTGLWLKGTILPTVLGNDVYTLAKAGALDGLSIGYRTKKHEFDTEKEIRKLIELELFEVSLVTFPANPKALITGVKERPKTIRELEAYLREGGFSNEEATTIALRGYKSLDARREVEVENLYELTHIFNQIRGLTS
jgi:hypothetical protein